MTLTSRFPLGTAASCLLLAIASPSVAQTTTPAAQPPAAAPSPPAAQAPASPPSERQLRNYARAVVELVTIQQEMGPRIQAAAEQERPVLEQQANDRMVSAVRRHYLDRQAFNQISAAIEHDPQLAQQVRTYVQEQAARR